jgi:hypothetical protein
MKITEQASFRWRTDFVKDSPNNPYVSDEPSCSP